MIDVEYNERKNQKNRDDIAIGYKTREYLEDCKTNGTMNSDERAEFFASVREYFVTAADYVIKKFPINNPFLLNAEVADIKNRTKASFKSVKYFVELLPCLHKYKDELDVLEMEFLRYQITALPQEYSSATMRIDTV